MTAVVLALVLLAGQPEGYLSTVLDNGLRVSILPVPENTVVATQLWYHIGSANETPGSRGFAHLFEHLMFGGTERFPRDEYEIHHHRHGGYENAYTSFDETVYLSQIGAEHHDQVLEMESDRMAHLVVDAENLENEQKIVSEELRVSMENDPFTRVWIATLAAVFGEHPYAHTPGGTREEVAAATLEQCRRFHADYYHPHNAHLVVVGPVDGPATLEAVRDHFGPLGDRGLIAEEIPDVLGWSFPDELVLKEDLPPAEIGLLAYPLPPPAHRDGWAIVLMSELLAGGEVDPFEELLLARRGKAVHAESVALNLRRGGALIFVSAHVPYRRKRTAFRLMDRARDRLGDLEWLTDESLASAKRRLRRLRLQRTFYPDRMANALATAHWWRGDEQLAFTSGAEIDAVTRAQVEQAFRNYVLEADPVRIYLRPEHVPLHIRLFGWLYPLIA